MPIRPDRGPLMRRLRPPFTIHPEEPRAANVLRISDKIAIYSGYSRTLEILRQAGYAPTPVEMSELIKADSGMTCSSIVFNKSA